VNRFGLDAGIRNLPGEFVGTVLGAGENHRQFTRALGAEVIHQQGTLVLFRDETNPLLDLAGRGDFRLDADRGRIPQDFMGELHDRRRKRRGKEQRLTAGWQQGNDAFHIAQESHVEHPVHFIEDEEFHPGKIDVALVDQIEQAARAGDEDVHAFAQGVDLRVLTDTAVNERMTDAEVGAVGFQAFADLGGQLARRREDEHAGASRSRRGRPAVEGIEDGQGECRRFPSACLGATQQVAALEDEWDRLRLDGRRMGVAAFGERALNGRSQGQRLEGIRCHVGLARRRETRRGQGSMRMFSVKPGTFPLIDEDRTRAEARSGHRGPRKSRRRQRL